MRIITINREFGSGGREVGKRLADVLHYRYYDSEIINAISLESNMDEGYVSSMLESGSFWDFPITYGNTFASFAEPQSNLTRLLVAERRVILDIAKKGENCVIVGRNADEILHGYHRLCRNAFQDRKVHGARKGRKPHDRKGNEETH